MVKSTLNFKCTLLTDVILNQKSATEGSGQTLDFIPGNNFLGIVASQLYDNGVTAEEALVLFHSGDVKFGDAHPSKEGIRGVKIPASMFYPKQGEMEKECYIHHLVKDLSAKRMKDMQLKQCRSGFYCFSSDNGRLQAEKVQVNRNFAIKSAYDKASRRSKDEMMYGYESLEKGSIFYFEVCFGETSEGYKEKVKECLVGERRIGRSRTAQYGLVKIEECNYGQPCSKTPTDDKYVTVYADGRLIFLDEWGIPTFQPSAEDLGLPGGKICWDKSQIRTFQYAPWNYKRQTYDTDRCGIEKGSVFVVEAGQPSLNADYVGVYQNEGFGKVIYNPCFLLGDDEGKALCRFVTDGPETVKPSVCGKQELTGAALSLMNFLTERKEAEETQKAIYEKVNWFVDRFSPLYKGGEAFAAQWGSIRSIAMNPHEKDLRKAIMDYLSKGVAAEKWNKKQRKEKMEDFMDSVSDAELRNAIVNLAAEMGKSCR